MRMFQAISVRACRVVATIVSVAAIIFSALLVRASANGIYRPDYSVFWTAAHVVFRAPDRLYDSLYMTAAQSWLAPTSLGPRPYAYPPSALIGLTPFSVVPFWPSLIAWDAISLLAFVAAARQYATWPLLILAVISPPTVLSLLSGQTSIVVGAACLFGMSNLNKRPVAAGLALGMAAAIKPQALIVAPILLSGNRTALSSFFGGGGAIVLVSLAFGPHLWTDWIAALPGFMRDVDRLGLVRWGATPATLAIWLRLDETATLAVRAIGIAAAVLLALWARQRPKPDRIVALAGGAILCSPYAMTYDMVALMPVAATALFSETLPGLLIGLPIIGFGAVTLPPMTAALVTRRQSRRQV